MKLKVTVDKLHRLIKTLKKAEKRYFKMNVNHQKGGKYLELFDYLDKVSSIKKNEYKEAFSHVKQLSSLQTYLYQQLLSSLQQQYNDSSIALQLQQGIMQIEILYQRELVYEAQELTTNLLQTALEKECFLEAELLFSWWFKCENLHFRYLTKSTEEIEKIEELRLGNLNKIQEYSYLTIDVSNTVFKIKDSSARKHKDLLNQIMTQIAIREKATFFSFKSKLLFLQWKALIFGFYRNNTEAKKNWLEIVSLLQNSSTSVLIEYKRAYITALISTICNLLTSEKELFEKINEELKQIPIQDFTIREKSIWKIVQHQRLIKNYELEAALALANEIEVEDIQISNHHKHQFYLDCAINHLALQQYDNTLDCVDKIIDAKIASSITLLGTAYLLKAIAFYEKRSYQFLPYLLQSIRKKMKSTGILFEFECSFIAFLKKVSSINETAKRTAFQKFLFKYQQHIKAMSKQDKEFAIFFNYEGWLISHANNTAFTKLMT